MPLNDDPPDFLKEFRDPEFALAYFVGVAARGDRVELDLAIQHLVRVYPHVELTKQRASPHPTSPPGNWHEYRLGDRTNQTSLPVDYVLTGLLLWPILPGIRVKVLRLTRNEVVMPGVFESTEVVAGSSEVFTTLNSIYRVRWLPYPPPPERTCP